MKLILSFVLPIALVVLATGSFIAGIPAWAEVGEKTRQVIAGDVIYSVQARAGSEDEAVKLAEARAAHYLSVECSVPPREARIYSQQTARTQEWVTANIQVGVALEDCEAARRAPSVRKLALANLALLEAEKFGTPAPAATPAPARAVQVVYFIRPAALESLPAPSGRVFTAAELQSHERALDLRLRVREAERKKALAEFRRDPGM